MNIIAPTTVSTPMVMHESFFRPFRPDLNDPGVEDVKPALQRLNLLEEPWLEAHDVSTAVVFLASDGARRSRHRSPGRSRSSPQIAVGSVGGPSTVYDDGLAGHVRACIAREEQDDPVEVIRPPETGEQRVAQDPVLHLGHLVDLLRHLRSDPTGCDAVDTDAVAAPLRRPLPRDRLESPFDAAYVACGNRPMPTRATTDVTLTMLPRPRSLIVGMTPCARRIGATRFTLSVVAICSNVSSSASHLLRCRRRC